TASLPYTLTDKGASQVRLAVTFQGCHEVDPKICYPPHTEKLTLALPTADMTSRTLSDTGQAGSLLPAGPTGSQNAQPLPPEKAFRFSAIATAPDQLLLRWEMPKGYYLYRDKTQLKLVDADGITLGTPQWPTGVAHHDA